MHCGISNYSITTPDGGRPSSLINFNLVGLVYPTNDNTE